jgi:GT2 family glycosyltransferase/uncharacterized small protein (DUF1192 family)
MTLDDSATSTISIGDELLWEPVRLASPNPWVGHIPFAYWLIKAMRPRALVELGTHSGNSFVAFCQAVAACDTGTRAFAVDTWQGDPQAGFYGEQTFADLQAFVRAQFGAFTTLLRTTFDEARPYFGDGEVDLLHIDGLHTYEAVRHDFETWRPTLSARGVVVLHDINVRERAFGVWRLWRELSAECPAFAFDHSHGLGVLGVGPEQPEALQRLFALQGEPAAQVRRVFAARGAAMLHRLSAQEAQDRIGVLEQEVARSQAALQQAEAQRDAGRPIAEAVQALGDARQALLGDRTLAADALLEERRQALLAHAAMLRRRDALLEARDAEIETLKRTLREVHQKAHEEHAAMLQAVQQAQVQALDHARALLAEEHRRADAAVSRRGLRLLKRVVRRALPRRAAPAAPPPPPPPPPEEAVAETTQKDALRSLLRLRLAAFLAGSHRLVLPRAEQPDVSVVLVLYNQAELTFGCLTSIIETLDDSLGAEVVILDNGSSDQTGELLARVDGATILRGGGNLHFLRGANKAARHARGSCILLLNNDAQLQPGAVQSALATLRSGPDIGAVGARIVLPDGTLQEAGSIVWNDGTCLGYGRGRDPTDPEFMFRRDVDYCSGAFMLTPRAVWEGMGGFDERYAPAYYEETDYCLRLWEAGLRVVYDPDVTILHMEFGSADGAAQALDLQQRNWRAFAERHAEWLRGQYAPGSANAWLARTARRLPGRPKLRRVLMIEDRIPRPELGAGYPRSHRILAELVEGGAQVTFFPTYRHPETWDAVRRVVGNRVEVLIRAQGDQMRPFLDSRRDQFDAILVCRPHNMAFFLDGVGTDRSLIGHAKVIYDAEAVFSRRDALRAALDGSPLSEQETVDNTADEMTLTRLADLVVSVSDAERLMFQQHGLGHVFLLGHVVPATPTATPFAERTELLFLGTLTNDREPNADSVRWFAGEVLPKLRETLGRDVKLRVVGPATAPKVLALEGTALEVVGPVDVLESEFARARVMVVPTRYAAGISHKAHQAAAHGVPMVCTRLIARQLGWTPGRDLLAEDDPQAFADACAALFRDEALWQSVRDNALERCREECSADGFRDVVRRLLEAIPASDRTQAVLAPEAAPPPERGDAPEDAAPPGYVGRDAAEDFSAAVPFGYAAVLPDAGPVGVLCHIFHADLAAEMRSWLGNIPVPADLFLTTDTEAKQGRLQRLFADWRQGDVAIRVVPNRGRDIAPKLLAFPEAYERELLLHVHTKRSLHDHRLAPWRGFLLGTLLGSPEIVQSVLDAFAREPTLGMVAPQHLEFIRHWLDWGSNFPAAKTLAARLGFALSPARALDFPSGSMFWARSAALRPLLDLRLNAEDFPEEDGQQDATLAHAVERLYFMVCERAGYDWMKIARPEFFHDPKQVMPIDSPAALATFLHRHRVRLLGSAPPAPAAAAPGVVPTVPPGLLFADQQRNAA